MSDAYQEGYDAFNRGLTLRENPYEEEAGKKKNWEDGWEDAKLAADLKQRSICSEQG